MQLHGRRVVQRPHRAAAGGRGRDVPLHAHALERRAGRARRRLRRRLLPPGVGSLVRAVARHRRRAVDHDRAAGEHGCRRSGPARGRRWSRRPATGCACGTRMAAATRRDRRRRRRAGRAGAGGRRRWRRACPARPRRRCARCATGSTPSAPSSWRARRRSPGTGSTRSPRRAARFGMAYNIGNVQLQPGAPRPRARQRDGLHRGGPRRAAPAGGRRDDRARASATTSAPCSRR